MLVHTQWYGTFVLERDGDAWTVVEFTGAPRDAGEIAAELSIIAEGGLLERERKLASREITHISEERLRKLSPDALLVDLREISIPDAREKDYPVSLIVEANRLKARIRRPGMPEDGNIVSAVGALRDIDSSLNLVQERISEWYSRYWPGAGELVDDPVFLSLLAADPDPGKIMKGLEADHPLPAEKRGEIKDPEGRIQGISGLADLALSLRDSREGIESYIEGEMERVAPNLSMVTGPLVGARLIHSAGGLMRLARLPSSTVQVLGAEKMFFKFLKEGGKPPKHGVLFQHPWVHSLPVEKRGKMARSLASAAALAAKMDAYGGGDATSVKERMERRAREIREMKVGKREGGGRQPPFREGWWANKGRSRDYRKRGRKKRK